MTIKPWKITHSRNVVCDRWLTLRADRCETAAGVVIEPYYVQAPEDWVQVVAFDAKDRILVTRQYRHGAGIICTELPCGVVEHGETPAQAAARELLEETGCASQAWTPLPVLSPNPARYSNHIHPFIATGTERIQAQHLDESEEIEFEFIGVNDLLSLIEAGSFSQALHIATVFLAFRRLGIVVRASTSGGHS
jgi:8-oxo-dGTP pyrophosphatase MutT (NUDIX family)